MHSMKVHYTTHIELCMDSDYNTGTDWLKQIWHIIGVTHCTLTQHTTHSAGEMAACIHGSLKAFSDVMHLL